MRQDRQHKDERMRFLGIEIYPSSHDMCAPRWFCDMCEAAIRLARKYEPRINKRIGASTGGVWSCLWAWANLPEPYKSELNDLYLQVLIEKAEKRKREDAEDTP